MRGSESTNFDIKSISTNPNGGEITTDVVPSSCRQWDASHDRSNLCDLAECSLLSEAPLLDVLRQRFLRPRPQIYTYVSDIVVAINPYKYFPHLNAMETPLKRFKIGKDPHVWATADFAYVGMLGEGGSPPKSQSVVISGESGAGKTVSCNNVMTYLTCLSKERIAAMETRTGRKSSVREICIEEKILACNPFLEAFGNATTMRNDNSSRFGRYTKILYDKGRIVGAKMEDYLLEKSRVVQQPAGNRNYHVFYYMIRGLKGQVRKELQLLADPQAYAYTRGDPKSPSVSPAGSVDAQAAADASGFQEIARCLDAVGLDRKSAQRFLWRVLTAILELGNVDFVTLKGSATGTETFVALKSDDGDKDTYPHDTSEIPRSVKRVAELLGLPVSGKDGLPELLVNFVMKNPSRNEPDIHRPYKTVAAAKAARDALAKMLYHDIFKLIVAVVNSALSPKRKIPTDSKFIGVLDIFGFEIFTVNSFSQLLINYANEMLQSLFNDHIFKNEVKLYKAEELDISGVEFKDNAPCCRLIDAEYSRHRYHGILSLLDDFTLRPKVCTDDEWGRALKRNFFENPKKQAKKSATYLQLAKPKQGKRLSAEQNRRRNFKGNTFWIAHYAGDVGYSTKGFLSKNRDKVPAQLMQLLRRSSIDAVRETVGISTTGKISGALRALETKLSAETSSPKSRSRNSRTIGSKFRVALASLSKTIQNTRPHYIRCVQPNNFKMASDAGNRWESFDGVKVQAQLVRAGLMETIAIRKRGFPFRRTYTNMWEFLTRLKCDRLLSTSLRRKIESETDDRGRCITFLDAVNLSSTTRDEASSLLWAPGKTMLFGKDSLLRSLESWRERRCVDTVQRWSRHYLARRRWFELERSVWDIQRAWRAELARRAAAAAASRAACLSLLATNDAAALLEAALACVAAAVSRRAASAALQASESALFFDDRAAGYVEDARKRFAIRVAASMGASVVLSLKKTLATMETFVRDAERSARLAREKRLRDQAEATRRKEVAQKKEVERKRNERLLCEKSLREEAEATRRKEESARDAVQQESKGSEIVKDTKVSSSDCEVDDQDTKRAAASSDERSTKKKKSNRMTLTLSAVKRVRTNPKVSTNDILSGPPGLPIIENKGERRLSSRRETLLMNLAKSRRKSIDRQTEKVRAAPPRHPMPAAPSSSLNRRKSSGRDALTRAFNLGSSSTSTFSAATVRCRVDDEEFRMKAAAAQKLRRARRRDLVVRLFDGIEKDFAEKKEESKSIFTSVGTARFSCEKLDKMGIRRHRNIILCRVTHRLQSVKPGGGDAKQIGISRIIDVRRDGDCTCRLLFTASSDGGKRRKANRPYDLRFFGKDEADRFVRAIDLLRAMNASAPTKKKRESFANLSTLSTEDIMAASSSFSSSSSIKKSMSSLSATSDGSMSTFGATTSTGSLFDPMTPLTPYATASEEDLMSKREDFAKVTTSKGSRWVQMRFSVIKTNKRGVRQERVLSFKAVAPNPLAAEEDPSMWVMASMLFATPPYSNGKDARYESVKAALRGKYGPAAINATNKKRLKDMAKGRGTEPSFMSGKSNSRHTSYHITVSTLEGLVKKEIDVDRVVEVDKGRAGTANTTLHFGAPFYYSYVEAFKHSQQIQQKPYELLFGREEQRDEFATSLLWIQQASREAYAERKAELLKSSMLGGGKGRIWKISYRSTKRWWPHSLAWRCSSNEARGAIAIFRSDLPQSTPLRDRVVVRFAPSRLRSVALLSRVLWPHSSVVPTDAVGLLFVIDSGAGTRRIGVIFGSTSSARDFLNFAVEQSGCDSHLELSGAVDRLRDPEGTDGFLASKFLGGQRLVDDYVEMKAAPEGFSSPVSSIANASPAPPSRSEPRAPLAPPPGFVPRVLAEGGASL